MEKTIFLRILMLLNFISIISSKDDSFIEDPFSSLSSQEIGSSKDITFWFFQRDNPSNFTIFQTFLNIEDSCFDNYQDFVLIIHGFFGSGTADSVTSVAQALLEYTLVNVVIVDWEKQAQGPSYLRAVQNVPEVGRQVSKFLKAAITLLGFQPKQIHLIGFSLGAQVAGIAGYYMKEMGYVVGKITALDPAKPKFDEKNPTDRLDSKDTEFLQVIHTSGDFLTFENPIGHADFYPNGGVNPQPECKTAVIKLACSHFMAYKYYSESIRNQNAFPSYLCNSWEEFEKDRCHGNEVGFMGYNASTRLKGKFYLRTNKMSPYGQNLSERLIESTAKDVVYEEISSTTNNLSSHMTIIVLMLMFIAALHR